jgi:hypothetical protein
VEEAKMTDVYNGFLVVISPEHERTIFPLDTIFAGPGREYFRSIGQ